MKTRYYLKSVRYNGGIIRRTRWGWQAEINKAPHRLRQSFNTQEDAKTWVDEKQTEIYNDGIRGLNLTTLQRIEAAKAIQTLGTIPLTAAVAYYMRHHKPAGGTRTLSAFFKDYMTAKAQANLRPRSIQGLRRFCGDLIKAMGDRGIHETTTADLDQWLTKCQFRPVTRNNHITYARGFFNAAIRAGLIEKNPATDLERPILDERVPGVFAVADVAKLLTTAAGSRECRRLTPFLAIGFFAGLRTSELDALQWTDVDLVRRLITVPATIAKKRRQGYVSISDNLLAWLGPYAACMAGRVTPADSTRRRVLGHLVKETGIHWVQNGMRHSFGSYHLAAFGDPHQTANQMRHRGDTSVLLDHYRALVRPDEAHAYWQIKP